GSSLSRLCRSRRSGGAAAARKLPARGLSKPARAGMLTGRGTHRPFRPSGVAAVALTPVDRDLLHRCLNKQPGSWNDFVDRFLSLIYHAIHYTAHLRSARVTPEDVEDIAAEVMLQIVADDYKVLRQFKGHASLATYLTVIARRICVHELTRRQNVREAI